MFVGRARCRRSRVARLPAQAIVALGRRRRCRGSTSDRRGGRRARRCTPAAAAVAERQRAALGRVGVAGALRRRVEHGRRWLPTASAGRRRIAGRRAARRRRRCTVRLLESGPLEKTCTKPVSVTVAGRGRRVAGAGATQARLGALTRGRVAVLGDVAALGARRRLRWPGRSRRRRSTSGDAGDVVALRSVFTAGREREHDERQGDCGQHEWLHGRAPYHDARRVDQSFAASRSVAHASAAPLTCGRDRGRSSWRDRAPRRPCAAGARRWGRPRERR